MYLFSLDMYDMGFLDSNEKLGSVYTGFCLCHSSGSSNLIPLMYAGPPELCTHRLYNVFASASINHPSVLKRYIKTL